MSINILRRMARATSLAAVIVAASGVLESTGLPLSAAVGNATLDLASVQSETEKLRRKMTGALAVASFRPGTAGNENRVKPMSDLRSGAGLHSTEGPLAQLPSFERQNHCISMRYDFFSHYGQLKSSAQTNESRACPVNHVIGAT